MFQILPPRSLPHVFTVIRTRQLSDPTLTRHLPFLNDLPSRPSHTLPPVLIGVLQWLFTRCSRLVEANIKYEPNHPRDLPRPDWTTSGVLFDRAPYRHRPFYPGLGEQERKGEEEVRADSCNKYYSSYSATGKTSGMCGFWCNHSIGVGLHFMSKAEGRNDVFSGIYAYWKECPKVIIYDYACSLASYCYLREFKFFSDVRHHPAASLPLLFQADFPSQRSVVFSSTSFTPLDTQCALMHPASHMP